MWNYYRFDPTKMSLTMVAERWAWDGDKASDGLFLLPVSKVWTFRDYTWTRETARDGGIGVRGEEFRCLEGPDKWDAFMLEMRTHGWHANDPAHMFFGRDGKVKLGEGNHRLAVAREVGLTEIPVRFHFYSMLTPSSEAAFEPRKVAWNPAVREKF